MNHVAVLISLSFCLVDFTTQETIDASFKLSVKESWCERDGVVINLKAKYDSSETLYAHLYLNDFVPLGVYELEPRVQIHADYQTEKDVIVENLPVGNHTVIAVLSVAIGQFKRAAFVINQCHDVQVGAPETYKLAVVAPKHTQPYTWISTGRVVQDWANQDSNEAIEPPGESMELIQDEWGCIVLGMVVVPGKGSEHSRARDSFSIPAYQWNETWERHLYVDGAHSRLPAAERGWFTVHRTPGPLRVDAVITDDTGDVIFAATARIRLVAPPPAPAPDPTADRRRLRAALELGPEVLISCLHPTRGRPHEALAVRQLWMSRARHPDRVEWIFAVDSDDVETLVQLGRLVREPGGGGPGRTRVVRVPLEATYHVEGTCTGGWNAAAAAAAGRCWRRWRTTGRRRPGGMRPCWAGCRGTGPPC